MMMEHENAPVEEEEVTASERGQMVFGRLIGEVALPPEGDPHLNRGFPIANGKNEREGRGANGEQGRDSDGNRFQGTAHFPGDGGQNLSGSRQNSKDSQKQKGNVAFVEPTGARVQAALKRAVCFDVRPLPRGEPGALGADV